MKFCWKCGNQLNDNAIFCDKCGTNVSGSTTQQQNNSNYKCPYCGDILPFGVSTCPTCGNELRGLSASQNRQVFNNKLESIDDPKKRILLIKNYAIPNTREDVIEFMILASSHYYSDTYDSVDELEAWKKMMDQCYEKAHLLLNSKNDLETIDKLYYGKNRAQNENLNKKKNVFMIIGLASMLTCIISIIGLVSSIKYFVNNSPYTNETIEITPNVLTESSSLNGDKSFTCESSKDGLYYASILIKTDKEAGLGDYRINNYIYRSYSSNIFDKQNSISVTFNIFDSKTNESLELDKLNKFSVYVYTGTIEKNSALSSDVYQVNDNIITYYSKKDIYLYSLKLNFEAHSYPEKDDEYSRGKSLIALSIISLIIFSVSSVVFCILWIKQNSKYKESGFGREKYIRQRELEEEKKKETIND